MKKVLIFLLVAGVIAATWFWFKKPSATENAEEPKPPAVAPVETALLKTQVIAETIEAFGVVAAAPSGDQVITAPFDCLIRRVVTSPGTRVAAGDVLLEISPTPDAKLQLDTALSTKVITAKALAAAQERYNLKLANNQELIAAQQAETEASQKFDSLIERGLGTDGKISAASAGIVGKLDLSVGALAPAGTVLVTITTEAQLEARLGVEAADVTQISAGQTVTLFSASRPDAPPITATVRIAGRSLDAVTGAAEVRVPLPAGAPLLLGEHVKATIEVKRKETLVAPRSAVLPDDGKLVFYTVKNGRAGRHEVASGISAGDQVEVSGTDLHDGDTVVTLGNYELSDGMAVQLQAPDSATAPKPASGPTLGVKEAKP